MSVIFLIFMAGFSAKHFHFQSTLEISEFLENVESYITQYDADSLSDTKLSKISELISKKKVIWNKEGAYKGYTLFTYRYSSNAFLADMTGKIVYRWQLPFNSVWKNQKHIKKPVPEEWIYLEKAHVFPNGDLIAVYTGVGDTPYGYGMVKVDKDSNVLWTYAGNTHHDFTIDPKTGNIFALTQTLERSEQKLFETESNTLLIDEIVILSPDGQEIQKFSIPEAIQNSPYALLLNDYLKNSAKWDRFHTNSINILTPELSAAFPMFKEGNLLISIRNLDTVAVFDMAKKQIIWAYNGLWRAQHSAHFLSNGNILVFDNKGHAKDKHIYSRVIELDPKTLGVSWHYAGNKNNPFFTDSYGRVQRLPNGNTLIVESLNSRVFEVTPNKNIVWDYRIPQKKIKKTEDAPQEAAKEETIAPYYEEPLLFNPYINGIIVSATRYGESELNFILNEDAAH